MQSSYGKSIIKKINNEKFVNNTVIFLNNDKIYYKSDAIIEILKNSNGILYFFSIIKLIPKSFRDSIYDIISRNRNNICNN